MKRNSLLATAMVALLATGLAAVGTAEAGNQGQGRGAKMFERHDTNNDGKITEEEFVAYGADRFKKMDLDGNGEVTKEEAQTAFDNYRAKGRGNCPGGQGNGPGPKQGQPQ